jgi:hypothetical protein
MERLEQFWIFTFHICISVHHQSIILINQLDAALRSLIYSLLRFTLHVSGAFCTHHQEYNQTIVTVIGTFLVSVWCGLNPLPGVQGRESVAQCQG